MRVRRRFSVGALALGLVVAGATTARAASAPAIATQHHRASSTRLPGPISAPLKIAPRSAHPLVSGHQGVSANGDSFNWSGYVASGGSYTSVSSTWVVPTVSCTTNGTVADWVGLDLGSPTVEQTGTGVSCATGSPQYYAWYEMYPNASSNYPDSVNPGDSVSSTVTYLGNSEYRLLLTDATAGWTENNVVAGPSGAENASAEVVNEAASANGATTALPDFGSVYFSGSTFDGGSLQSANAQGEDMVNGSNDIIAKTGLDDTTGDFTVYDGSGLPNSSPKAALQASTNYLWLDSPGSDSNLGLGMATGTSPAIAGLEDGGYETAFQANTNSLWVVLPSGVGQSLNLGMKPGTSPAITGLANGSYEVAFQADTGNLFVYSPATGDIDTGYGMAGGTSPAIAASPAGGFEVAFQANTDHLWLYSPATGGTDLNYGMATGTSPAITALSNGTYETAFQADTNYLWLYSPSTGGTDLGYGMAGGTSPAIAASPAGGFEAAFQANTNYLWLYSPSTGGTDLNYGMAGGTSPAITAPLTGDYYYTGFQANTTSLWIVSPGNSGTAINLDMAAGTSPSLAG